MTDSHRRYPALVLAISAAMLVLAACSTEEVRPPVIIPGYGPSADRGALLIAFAPPELTYAEWQQVILSASTGSASGYLFCDGAEVDLEHKGYVYPLPVGEGYTSGMGFLPAGSHHFEIKTDLGRTTVFAGDGEIPAGSLAQLYLFGPAGAVQGRFVSYPASVAPGTIHVSLINLVRTGQSIEVVGCTAASGCVPLSSPIALGEIFSGDFPMETTQDGINGQYVVTNGAALGYRQVPTPAVPNPPVQPVTHLVSYDSFAPAMTLDGTPVYMVAPIYMSPTGDLQASL
jgi:hypothetical protein